MRWKHRLLTLFTVTMLAVVADFVLANPIAEVSAEAAADAGVDAGLIPWMVEEVTTHRVHRDPAWADEVTRAAEYAGADWGFDPLLLMAMAYRETEYRPGMIGSRGERGLLQVGHGGRRYPMCREVCGELATPDEHMACGACWLRAGVDWCRGDLYGGMLAYAYGKCRAPRDSRAAKAVRKRVQLWGHLRQREGLSLAPVRAMYPGDLDRLMRRGDGRRVHGQACVEGPPRCIVGDGAANRRRREGQS